MRLIDADVFRRVLDTAYPFTKDEQRKHGMADMAKSGVLLALDQTPTAFQWIPVTERSPDISKSVLICDIEGDIYLGHRTRYGDYYPDFFDDRIKSVIAWMPLPEPYKEEQK